MNDNITILLIDDDEMIHRFINLLLSKEGYQIVISASREAALAALSETTPNLIIIDKNLGGEDGGELCLELKGKSELSNTPILLISGYPMSEEEYGKYQADGFIAKPINTTALKADIKNILK